MKYKNLLITDKFDIDDNIRIQFPGCVIVASTKDLKPIKDIKILSANTLKINEKILKMFPSLEWIICRNSNIDPINQKACKKYNVGVISENRTKPMHHDLSKEQVESLRNIVDLITAVDVIGTKKYLELEDVETLKIMDLRMVLNRRRY